MDTDFAQEYSRLSGRPSRRCKMNLIVQHRVADFDSWKPAFDAHETARIAAGAKRHWVFTDAGDPNDVVVVIEFDSRAQAEVFLADPSLPEAMANAGVVGEPHVHYRELVEKKDY